MCVVWWTVQWIDILLPCAHELVRCDMDGAARGHAAGRFAGYAPTACTSIPRACHTTSPYLVAAAPLHASTCAGVYTAHAPRLICPRFMARCHCSHASVGTTFSHQVYTCANSRCIYALPACRAAAAPHLVLQHVAYANVCLVHSRLLRPTGAFVFLRHFG